MELQCSREEVERVRERFREAMVSSTRSSLQTTQLAEELEAARQQAAKAERNAVREARKATMALEEKVNLIKRCELLEKQLAQLRETQNAHAERRNNNVIAQSKASTEFRVRSVDDHHPPAALGISKQKHQGLSSKNTKRNKEGAPRSRKTKHNKGIENHEESEDDPEQAEFDFM